MITARVVMLRREVSEAGVFTRFYDLRLSPRWYLAAAYCNIMHMQMHTHAYMHTRSSKIIRVSVSD